tara:strand:+ start:3830 stop:5164 length:1335 start_codon:yes stop_codon:yes gene_type:complete
MAHGGIKTYWIIGLSATLVLALFLLFYPKNPLVSYYQPRISQNLKDYIPATLRAKRLVSIEQQRKNTSQFLAIYFAPWRLPLDTKVYTASPLRHTQHNIQKEWQSDIDALAIDKVTYYGANLQPYTQQALATIIQKARQYKPMSENAIVVQPTYLRLLPFSLPLYHSNKIAGQGYPFDDIQYSSLWIGQPVRIIGQTQDQAWDFVVLSGQIGWVKSLDMARVSQQFEKQYIHSPFVAITHDDEVAQKRIGMILPVINHIVEMPARDPRSTFAELVVAHVKKKDYVRFPIPMTGENMMMLMQQMIGEPYSWGGLNYYRDCSATVQSLYAAFGLWLPRNSAVQTIARPKVDLSALADQDKIIFIEKKAKPLMTLLSMPGHITIYLGRQHGRLYVLHDSWGMKTEDMLGHLGRAVIGKVVVSSQDLGHGVPYVHRTLLSLITAMTNL